jgi:murein DD-endopeptidase MepM/ murein hydrolase activator NlpD
MAMIQTDNPTSNSNFMNNMNKLKKHLSKSLFLGASSIAISIAISSVASAQSYLPYPTGKSYSVTQTWESNFSHNSNSPINRYAVDFGMPRDSNVVAVEPGKVVGIKSNGDSLGRGCNPAYINNANYVIVDHGNNKSSVYLHLNRVDVSVGQSVRQGQQLGLSGNTGYTCGSSADGTGPHLHFAFQKTQSTLAASIPGGFVETSNAKPLIRSYTSQNKEQNIIPSASMAISVATGRALDSGGSNGTSIYLHPRPDNNPYQRWRFDSLGNGEYRISAVPTGRVLDGGGSNGGTAYLHPQWIPNNNYQKWRLQPGIGGYMLINVATGRALDAGGSNNTLTYMHPNPNGSNPHHVWRLPG